MADYFSPTVVQPAIPLSAMTALERLLLSRIFSSEPDGDGLYLFAEQGLNDMPAYPSDEVRAALAASGDVESQAADIVRAELAKLDEDDACLQLDMTDKAINEIRGWHDRTRVGIALLGNDKVISQFDSRKSALAQVSSRFSYRHEQLAPFPGDVDACLDAWGIRDQAQRDFLAKLGLLPGALREITHTIEVALMTAFGEGAPLALSHLRHAARQRNAKWGAL
jgi:hypothetical protein